MLKSWNTLFKKKPISNTFKIWTKLKIFAKYTETNS